MFKKFLLFTILISLLSAPCFAMDDKEYEYFLKTYPEFADCDRDISKLWKKLKKTLPPNQFKPLLKEQRAWIKNGENLIKPYIKQGYSRVAAHTQACRDRIEELESRYFANNKQSDNPISEAHVAIPPIPQEDNSSNTNSESQNAIDLALQHAKANVDEGNKHGEASLAQARRNSDTSHKYDDSGLGDVYINQISQAIYSNLDVPQSCTDNLVCTVKIKLYSDGNISDVYVINRSSNTFYDQLVLNEIRRIAQQGLFQPPPNASYQDLEIAVPLDNTPKCKEEKRLLAEEQKRKEAEELAKKKEAEELAKRNSPEEKAKRKEAAEQKYKEACTKAIPDLRGPKIFGLQLGMKIDDARTVLERLGNRYNTDVESELYVQPFGGYELRIGFYAGVGDSNYDGVVDSIFLEDNIFNTDDINDKDFLQGLCKHYNLCNFKINNSNYRYENSKDGYVAGTYAGSLHLISIDKKSGPILE